MTFQGFVRPNTVDTPEDLFTEILPRINHLGELKVVLYTLFHTLGFRKQLDRISLDQYENGIVQRDEEGRVVRVIDRGTGLSRSGVVKALRRAVEDGYLVKIILCPHCKYTLKDEDLVTERRAYRTRHGEGESQVTRVPDLCPHCGGKLFGLEQVYYGLKWAETPPPMLRDIIQEARGVNGVYSPPVNSVYSGGVNAVYSQEEEEEEDKKTGVEENDFSPIWAAFAAQAGTDSYEPSAKDTRLAGKLLADGFTLAQIRAGIAEAFRRFRERRSRGRIRTFAYCVPVIREQAVYTRAVTPQAVSTPAVTPRTVTAGGSVPQAVPSDEACATAEAGSPPPETVAAHPPQGGPPPVPAEGVAEGSADGETEGSAGDSWERRVRELAASMGLSNSNVLVLMRYAGRYDPVARKQGETGMEWVCRALEKAAGRGADNPAMYVERVLEDWAERTRQAEEWAQEVREAVGRAQLAATVRDTPPAEPTSEAERLWRMVLDELKLQVTTSAFATWLSRTRAVELRDGTLVIAVPNGYTKDWLENRLRRIIERTLVGIVGRPVGVEFVCEQGLREEEICGMLIT